MGVMEIDNAARLGPDHARFRTFTSKEQLWLSAVASTRLAATQITDAYAAGVASEWVPTQTFSAGMLYINLITANATTIEVAIDHSPDATLIAVDHFREPPDASVASGPTETQFTVANYTPGATLALPIPLELRGGIKYFRVRVKRTGGASASTTCKLYWVGKVAP